MKIRIETVVSTKYWQRNYSFDGILFEIISSISPFLCESSVGNFTFQLRQLNQLNNVKAECQNMSEYQPMRRCYPQSQLTDQIREEIRLSNGHLYHLFPFWENEWFYKYKHRLIHMRFFHMNMNTISKMYCICSFTCLVMVNASIFTGQMVKCTVSLLFSVAVHTKCTVILLPLIFFFSGLHSILRNLHGNIYLVHFTALHMI